MDAFRAFSRGLGRIVQTETLGADGLSYGPSHGHQTFGSFIPGLVWAFRVDADGKAELLNIDLPIDTRGGGLLWLHFNFADSRSAQWLLSADLGFPHIAMSLLLSKDNFQQLHAADAVVYGIISDLVRDIDTETEETGYLHFAMNESVLVSGRLHALCAADATRRVLEDGHRVGTVAELLETIVERIAEAMERVAERIFSKLDDVEEEILSDGSADLRKDLGRLRRTCVRLHRQLSGLLVIFRRLDSQGGTTLKPALRLRAGKLTQRLDALDHAIVEMRERSRLLQEELHLKIEEQSSRSLHLLSVLTALLLPPTLIAGIFGMNTKGLPFVDVDSGFVWIACSLMASSTLAWYVMRRLGIVK